MIWVIAAAFSSLLLLFALSLFSVVPRSEIDREEGP